MGAYCYNDIDYILDKFPIEDGDIIWIDKNINDKEKQKYVTKLKKTKFKIKTFINIELGLNEIYKNNFKNIYLLLDDSIYIDFILKFKNNLRDIYVVPKIMIFTNNKDLILEKNNNIKDIIKNTFYNLGGIQTISKEAFLHFIIEKSWKKNYQIENKTLNSNNGGEQYTFEYINDKLELYLPVFYKALIKLNKKDIFDELTHYLYDTYKENKYVKELLEPIDEIPEVPIEILCKYYARLYTIESNFYKDLNKSLREENLKLKVEEILFSANKNKYYSITFIKSFYEGIKLDCFKFDLKDELYRFSCLKREEFNKINEYLENKKPEISAANLFSKTFLSFSEDKNTAEYFYGIYKSNKASYENKNLVPVLFHLIKEEDIKESLYSHIKINNISFMENEKEVLFLPFTCFEILKIIPIPIPIEEIEKEKEKKKSISNKKMVVKYYEIELTYLGKYEKDLKNIEKEEIIPDTEFKKSIEESNLIEIIQNITNKRIIDEFNEYENSFRKNDIYLLYDVKEDIDENNFVSIFGRNLEENGTDFVKENKEKIKILIDNEEKALEYEYKLKKGYHIVTIKINSDEILNLAYMFCGCTSLKSIEGLKNLDTKNIKNFSKMLFGCESLSDINALKNWNVSNGTNFEGMFAECNSLKDIKALENWNFSNGNIFSKMFYNCKSLSDIKALHNWNVSNGNNFSNMFGYCTSLLNVNALESWNVSNGNNFSNMFYNCKSLSDIKGLQNWNVSNANHFEGMFSFCLSLLNLNALENWNVSNGINFPNMFYGCSSLSDIKGLQNWNVSNGKNFSGIFRECKSLSDIKPLEKWDVSNCNNFSQIFYLCNSLSNIEGLQNWNVSNGINFSNMFMGCESLSDTKGLNNWNVSNGNNFSSMFCQCKSLSDIKSLQNWNVSNGNNFSSMFCQCESLSDIKSLQNWNVSNGTNFFIMFSGCNSLSDFTPIHNWNTNGYSFLLMTSNDVRRVINNDKE